MDLSNAFDCLPRGLITAKLYVYGLELPAFKLLFLMCMEENSALKFQIVEIHMGSVNKGGDSRLHTRTSPL